MKYFIDFFQNFLLAVRIKFQLDKLYFVKMEILPENFQNLSIVFKDDTLQISGNKYVRDMLTDHKMDVQSTFKIVIFPKKDSATLKGGDKQSYRSVFNYVFGLKGENEITPTIWEEILENSSNQTVQTPNKRICRSYSGTPNRSKPTSRLSFNKIKVDTPPIYMKNDVLEFSPRNLYKDGKIHRKESNFCQSASYSSTFHPDSNFQHLNFNSSDSTLTQPEIDEPQPTAPQVGLNIVGKSLQIKLKGTKSEIESINKIKSVLGLDNRIVLQRIVFN